MCSRPRIFVGVALVCACGLPLAGTGGAAVGADSGEGLPDAGAGESGLAGEDGSSGGDSGKDAVADVGDQDAAHDAATYEAGGPIVFVQFGYSTDTTATLQTKFPVSVTTGGFVAVMVTSDASAAVSRVVDDAPGGSNVYVSAGARSFVSGCQASDIWFARNVTAGAKTVTVTMSASVVTSTWILETTGMSPVGDPDKAISQAGSATSTITAPTITPSGVPALIVAGLGTCGIISGVTAGNPFYGFPTQHGNIAAYDIATSPGAWGPVLDSSGGGWNASIAAFR